MNKEFREKLADLIDDLQAYWDTKKRDKILKELRDLLNSSISD